MMPRKVLIALPPKMLESVDTIAEIEDRTRSDLVREALRQYIVNFNLKPRNLSVELTDGSQEEAASV